ncbi:hypothetical protein V5N11_014808 [Cardamine amara subsp. amara]|uniref:Uncharacterized protein n=1 Tax=Cardamine amara subsp. amara TaxID=228776 RepID=A0ABD1A4W2_CARAN
MRQKSRIRWLDEGDTNTRFFHKAVLAHIAQNAIRYIRDDNGDRIDDPAQVKDQIITYFNNMLGSENPSTSPYSVAQIKDLHPYHCPPELTSTLTAIPTKEEIRASLLSMPKSKAPRPDGFTMEFYRDAWDIVGNDLVKAVTDFFYFRLHGERV